MDIQQGLSRAHGYFSETETMNPRRKVPNYSGNVINTIFTSSTEHLYQNGDHLKDNFTYKIEQRLSRNEHHRQRCS